MSLVGRVGRKSWRARMAMLVLYGALLIGAITTLYPFLMMVATGMKGPTDQNDTKVIPSYFGELDTKDPETGKLSEASLLGKYLNDKYAGDASMIASTRIGADASAETVQQYQKFLEQLPVDYWSAGFKTASGQVTSRLASRYRSWLREKYGTIDAVNRAYIDENLAFQTVVPPVELLEKPSWKQPNTRKYQEWREFKATLPAEFRIPVRETRLWQEFLRTKFQNQFGQVPKEIAGEATSFEEVSLPDGGVGGPECERLADELESLLPERYRRGAAETQWYELLAATDPSLRKVEPIVPPIPIEAYERNLVASQATELRREFAGRNFAYVLDYVALNGRALWNTAIFCLLAVVTQLTVNPLAAYALSRYPIPASGKILIFLLATMAFPAEVALIPSFLLLKDLNMLNTFWALVLPTAASGYMIFLLKGFFDSLPQELFEAGQIDGAKETTMMAKIALPLSKPVLGYMALLAFMGAYGAFMYAFLVVQDQRMWTLMVWIYQLQNSAPKAVMMAALTLAAIPTLVVFLLAQRTIMRGIVLPSER